MKLHFREIGKGQKLLILHGLYACSDNWLSIAKALKETHHSIMPDCRNHGHSPKSDSHSYMDMSMDILELLDTHNISKISIIGHSMGGKAAMLFACMHPERVSQLIIIDIAPKDYNTYEFIEHKKRHQKQINLFKSIDLSKINNTRDLLFYLNNLDIDKDEKNLIAKNVFKNKNNMLEWRLNTSVIEKQIDSILNNNITNDNKYYSNCHFIKGEYSDYLKESDFVYIREQFPEAIFHIIPNCAHSIHIEQAQLLINTLKDILKD